MYGLRIGIGRAINGSWQADAHCFVRRFDEGDFHLVQWSLCKFEKDKLWLDTPDTLLVTEGVLFNRDAILASFPETDIRSWRGSFACVRYDKQTGECAVYTDMIGSKMLFWCQTKDEILVSPDLFELSRETGLTTPDEAFMEQILTRGYGHDESTIFVGIHRLCAGQCLRIRGRQVEVETYHRFDNQPLYACDETSLAETDRLFRQAVQRVLDKNAEYRLPNLFPLSGGLDSRMVQTVARRLTDAPITNFTYSQTGHYDHTLPEQISVCLGNTWQFLPLDGGDYLTQTDAITKATQALINYNGPSEIYYCTRQIDFSKAGMVLTGVNGDNIFSVITDSKHEIELLYSLSFAGNGLGSPLVLQQYTETYSPFCDVDVLEYVLHISAKARWNYRFYDRWIARYYPEAMKWDHKGERIGHRGKVLCIGGRHIPLRDLPKRLCAYVLKHLHIYNAYRIGASSMTPYDEWIQTNASLREHMTHYYACHKHVLEPYPRIAQQAKQMMETAPVYDQCAVLTILSALNR